LIIINKTTQARIGGIFEKFLHFSFIPHTTKKPETAKQRVCRISLFVGQYGGFSKMPKINAKNRKPFYDFLSWCTVLCAGGYSVVM
jgi:hypothetical protein